MYLKCLLGFILLSYVVAYSSRDLLSTKKCTWGPSFWCGNITNAKACHAVKHCIQTVWEHKEMPEDNDSVCNVCKQMVQQARDVLESNNTIEMIQQVFNGTCALIHIKPIVRECDRILDNYGLELVDMLSSMMNPGVVCSVAGLCNNPAIDKILADIENKKSKEEDRKKELQRDCESCLDFVDVIDDKIQKATQDDIKNYLLERCRSLASLSDSCANIVEEYTPDLYQKLKHDFHPPSLCHLSSSCVNGYTRGIQVKTESDVGVIHVNSDAISVAVKHLSDDQTCELCMQLVKHLKDILTANTTELEFKQVIEGICKQTGRFKSECLSISDEYYESIYHFLVNDLNGRDVCTFAGICAKPKQFFNGPISPLLPQAPVPIENDDQKKYGRLTIAKPDSNVRIFNPVVSSPKVEISFGDPLESKFQLPIQRMLIPQATDLNVNNREACMFCQYFLHYIQKVISQPYGENELKRIVSTACDKLPQSLTVECKKFVEEFGDSFVAILAQEIDPSQVCPALHICPARVLENKFEPLEITGNPGCPLCLMAIEDITEELKDNKTEVAIKHALYNLCKKMPKNLSGQCQTLVDNYSEEIIDMILADFTPQEVCTFLKLCRVHDDVEFVSQATPEDHQILTNEIPRDDDDPVIKKKPMPMCVLCEFVMSKVEEQLKDNYTDEEVKRAVLNACAYMPKSVRHECRTFVQKYSDTILLLLEQLASPKLVCSEMHMCKEPRETNLTQQVHQGVAQCAMCEAIVGALRGLAEDNTFDGDLLQFLKGMCYSIAHDNNSLEKCKSILTSYGQSMIHLLIDLGMQPNYICPKLQLCDRTEQAKVVVTDSTTPESHPQERPHLLGENSCTWGPSYWCQSVDHATRCGTLAHCREIVWKADKPPTPVA